MRLLGWFLFLAGSAASLQAQDKLSPAAAVELGLRNNFQIQIARSDAEIFRNQKGLGRANFLPTLTLSGNSIFDRAGQTTNSPFSFGSSSSRNLGGSIVLNWTLYDGSRMFAERNQYNELAKLGEEQARAIIEENVVAIMRSYFDLVQQEQLLKVFHSAMEVSETRLQKERVRRELGGASSTDLLNAEVAFNNDHAAYLNQNQNIISARKELNLLLGQSSETPISVEENIEVEPISQDLNTLLMMAEARNSKLRTVVQDKKVAEQGVRIARSSFLPELNLASNYDLSKSIVSSDNERFPDVIETRSNNFIVAVTLSYNLFNGFRNRIGLQNAIIEVRKQELRFKDEQLRLHSVIRDKLQAFQQQLRIAELLEQNITAAEQNLQLQQERLELGTASSLQFRDAQVNLVRARTALIGTKFQAKVLQLEIQQHTGMLKVDLD